MQTKIAIGAALAGAALLGAIAIGFSNAQSGRNDEFSTPEKDAIRQIVRDYILDNPEVLIDSLNAYAEMERANASVQSEQVARENLAALLNEEHAPSAGVDPANATVAVIEFFDYHCAYCKRASAFVRKLVKDDPAVKVVFREFPILRKESEFAAEYALATRNQGKYADFHFALFDEGGLMTEDRLNAVAEKLGVDQNLVEQALEDASIEESIDETHRIATEMGISGTPTFIIASLNGEFVRVVQGNRQDDVKAAIAEAKKSAKK